MIFFLIVGQKILVTIVMILLKTKSQFGSVISTVPMMREALMTAQWIGKIHDTVAVLTAPMSYVLQYVMEVCERLNISYYSHLVIHNQFIYISVHSLAYGRDTISLQMYVSFWSVYAMYYYNLSNGAVNKYNISYTHWPTPINCTSCQNNGCKQYFFWILTHFRCKQKHLMVCYVYWNGYFGIMKSTSHKLFVQGGSFLYVNFLQLMLHILFTLVWCNWFIAAGNYWHLHVYLISTKFHSKWIHSCQAIGHSVLLSYTLAYNYLVDSSIHMMRVRNNQCFDWPRPSFTGWIIMWNFPGPLACMCPHACMSHHIQSYPVSLMLLMPKDEALSRGGREGSLENMLHPITKIQYIPINMDMVLLCFALLWLCNRS